MYVCTVCMYCTYVCIYSKYFMYVFSNSIIELSIDTYFSLTGSCCFFSEYEYVCMYVCMYVCEGMPWTTTIC